MRGIIGKKIGMTRLFDDDGNAYGVTIVEAGPCYVTQVKSIENDGYQAIQVGFAEKKEKQATKPEIGHVAAAGLKPFQILKEFRDFETAEPLEKGAEIKVDIFHAGETVNVTGSSKGRGFAGVMRRHKFSGGPQTHGQSDRWRAPGSIGASSWPSRVVKGLRMAGRMGAKQVTMRNVKILKVDAENNIMLIKGAVPGANNSIVFIRK
ncbi:50S ribosomal protein L3 [candidate division KSB1 bacterium]|nr:50S ribosomal protein L3 [candidate division KSB1 bacterium]RQW11026.1 MAG: 50S ribosomal protein L3 [candidate division KSB1 bacterium]